MNRAIALLTVKAAGDGRRIFSGWATTPETDRMGDVIDPKGAVFKNPLALLHQHDHDRPIGVARLKRATKDGIEFEAEIPVIDEPGPLKNRVDTAWGEIKSGLVRAVSIGFRALSDGYEVMTGGGIHFKNIEIIELSTVSVPANSGATITAIKSIDRKLLAASGRGQGADRDTRPGGTGKQFNLQPRSNQMNTILEKFAAAKADRKVKADRIKELGELLGGDDGLSAEDQTEFDALSDEMKALDADIERMETVQRAMDGAKAVKGVKTPEDGAAARGGREPAKVTEKGLPKGTRFARAVMAIAAGRGSVSDSLEYAKRWKAQTPEVFDFVRDQFSKAVPGSTLDESPGWGQQLVHADNLASEFIELLRPATVMGRLNGLRRVPFNVSIPAQVGGSTVNWVGEKAPKPVTDLEFTRVTLGYTKIAGIVVLTEELVRLSSPAAEETVRRDLVEQIAQFSDEQFLDPGVTSSASRPASITNGVTGAPASGADGDALRYDLNVAFAAFDAVDLSTGSLHILMTPALARGISSLTNAFGQTEFPTVTPSGGTLMGYPVIVSNSVPSGNIILVNASEIFVANDGAVRLDASNEATLDLSGSTSPTFSLWQNNCIGIRAEQWIHYLKRRAQAVNRITSAAYGPEAPSG